MADELFETRLWARKTYVRLSIRDVQFHCRARNDVTKAIVTVEYTIRGGGEALVPEYGAIRSLVRSLADSRPWLAEELADAIAEELWRRFGVDASVKVEFAEGDDMYVEVWN